MMLNRTKGVSILQHPISLAILFFFLSMGIQLIGIDALSLTSDECFSIYHAQMSPRLIYQHLSTGNNPPLHEWILHYWMLWFGDSPFAVRFLSLIFSSLTTALIFVLGTQISAARSEENTANSSTGMIAAILFLSSNYSTFLAHEARTYNLTLFLGVLSTIAFIGALKSGKIKHFLIYGLIGGLLCLSHFFGIWILLAHGSFWLLWNKESRPALKSMIWAALGFGIAFGWYIPNLWYRFVDSASQGTWVNPAPWDAPYLTLWKYLNTPVATILAMILLVYAVVKLVAHQPSTDKPAVQKQNAHLLLWLFALPFFGQWLMSLDHPFSVPMFTERYASITLPFLCLILALALSGLREYYNQRLYNFALALFLSTILSGKNFTPANQASAKEALKTAKVSLGANWGKTPIILEPYHSAFQVLYYADHNRFKQYQFKQHQPHLIYDHLASQLSLSNIWILKTAKSLDSLGLSSKSQLTYLRFGTVKSAHTIQIEQQLEKLTNTGGNIKGCTIQIPKRLWGTTEITSEAEFWLIERK
jgi:4-amino-4-deoxy-L-arabinose transferase-like glycosyltransferase